MGSTFYFYDLETSGFNPRQARIMQFAGQRTDTDLKPIGEPDNILIRMTPDTLPDPDAILVTGITPQATLTDGITEAEFAKYITSKVFIPNTIAVGYNNIRFDDEFIRYTLWRNFYDSYEWHWKDGRSRWDLLDVVRMTRALRPHGIQWPFAPDGKPSNRLEYLSKVNKLEHANAHDALSDIMVTIEIARLIKTKQPKLFEYLLNMRGKQKVQALVTAGQPVVYTSGRYPSEYEKTTIAVRLADNPHKQGALMYDLRIDPDQFTKLSPQKLAELWSAWGRDAPYFPVKTLAYNKAPALAPLSVLSDETKERLKINMETVKENFVKLQKAKGFSANLLKALEANLPKSQSTLVVNEQEVDGMLYDGFVGDQDKTKLRVVRAAEASELSNLGLDFEDARLKAMMPLYKARNFPKFLSNDEQNYWEEFIRHRLLDGGEKSWATRYFKRLNELSSKVAADSEKQYLLEELNLYGQSIMPL
jgi:exodeoxyribonuclease-1